MTWWFIRPFSWLLSHCLAWTGGCPFNLQASQKKTKFLFLNRYSSTGISVVTCRILYAMICDWRRNLFVDVCTEVLGYVWTCFIKHRLNITTLGLNKDLWQMYRWFRDTKGSACHVDGGSHTSSHIHWPPVQSYGWGTNKLPPMKYPTIPTRQKHTKHGWFPDIPLAVTDLVHQQYDCMQSVDREPHWTC